ncbi:UNVERIFIED_CONTAM: hypothetical protein RMT77_010628 [Armadillidium vulgare]
MVSHSSSDEEEMTKNSALNSELELYNSFKYKEKTEMDLHSNPLEFWKKHTNLFPILSDVAKTFLAIPATSVESERMFSKAGDLISDRRTRLSSKNVEKIIFVNRNLEAIGHL